MGPRPVGAYPNPICHTISHISDIIKDRHLCRQGGISYGVDASRAEYEKIPKPQDTHHAENPWGGYPKVYPKPVYPISPTISIITILPILYHTG